MQKMSKKNNYKEKIIRFINKYFSFITENVNEKYTRKWKNKIPRLVQEKTELANSSISVDNWEHCLKLYLRNKGLR